MPGGSDVVAVRLNVVDAPVMQVQFRGVMDVPVTMQRRFSRTVEVPQIQLIAWFGGHPSSQQRQVAFHSWVR